MYIIGIASNCYGAGKTTLAHGLAETINSTPGMEGTAVVVSFASPIKHSAMDMIECIAGRGPFDKNQVILGNSVTYREVLIGLGQLARSWDPDFWLKAALYDMKRQNDSEGGPFIFIVDDMRFPNEFKYIQNYRKKETDTGKSIKEMIKNAADGSCTVYLTHEGYSGDVQNEAEGLLDPALFDLRVVRSIHSKDKRDSMANARRVFISIRDDLEAILLRERTTEIC